ncbi:MAG: hypothetical protein ABSA39_23035 [Edaphobacter sp.]
MSGVDGDLLYGLGFCGFGAAVAGVCRLGFGEVETGDLEAVEEKAGAAWVDVVGGDALQDLADGVLDGGAVFRERQVEGAAAAAALARVGDGFASGVVVVAEVFSAQAWAGAAVTVGEDVAALVLFGCFVGVVHRSPTGFFLCKVFGIKELSLDFFCFRVKGERPGFGPGLFSIYFHFIEVNETKMPFCVDLFLACRLLILSWLCDMQRVFSCFGA